MDAAYRRFVERSEIYRPIVPPPEPAGVETYTVNHAESQSRLESLLEACVNVASGFLVSWMVWVFVAAPAFDIPIVWLDSFLITCVFTVSSVARSYIWRRFFNASIHRRIHQWLAS